MTFRLIIGALLLALVSPAASATLDTQPDDIDRAFVRFYNFDFQGAHQILNTYLSSHPDDAMGYAVRAAVYLYTELDRLGILESEFFSDDNKITEKKKLKPDPEIRRQFFKAVEDARSASRSKLAAAPTDYHAMFGACMVEGLLADYTALIEKKQLGSLSYDKRSNLCAQGVLKAHPDAYDVYVTKGFTEYLVGSLPFFVKWFVHFDNVEGNKDVGIDNLQLVVRSGRYLKSFAKILLAVIYLREKKTDQTERILAELSQEYPENRVFRTELAKISGRIHGGVAGSSR
jgi:hypothetical protein